MQMNVKRSLSLVMILVALFAALTVQVFAAEAEELTEEVAVVETLSAEELLETIEAIVAQYGISADMEDYEIANAIAMADSETLEATMAQMELIDASAAALSEEELSILEGSEAVAAYDRFDYVMELLYTPMLLATTLTLLDGGLTITDSVGTGAESNGTVTITAKGSFLSKKTNTITLINETSATATLSFDYTVSNADSHTLPANSGTYSVVLEPGASTSFSITSKALNGTVTLKMSNFSLVAASASSNVTFAYEETLGTVTVGGTAAANGDVITGDLSGMALAATPNTNVYFLGWTDESGKILSTDKEYTLIPTRDMTVTAVFADNSGSAAPWYKVGGEYLFGDLNDAVAMAQSVSNKRIVLMNNATLPAGSYTIPTGVTLLIPFDTDETLYTTKPASDTTKDSKGNLTWVKPTAFRTLTMAEGAHLTVDGAMSLSGKYRTGQASVQSGSPSGPTSFVQMEEGSSITVNGTLYAWGFITGEGTVLIKNGASVYELFQFMDWRGGDMSTGMKNEVFPVSQYYIQNIEVPMTIETGAKEYAYTSVTVTLLGDQGAAINFFGSSGAMFNLASGTVTKRYDGTTDRLVVELDGEMSISPLKMSLGIYNIDSASYNLGINSNITVKVNDGSTVTIAQNVALLPGSEIIIDEGAHCTIASGTKAYLYDADTWGTYCGSANKTFMPVPYAPGKVYTRTEADLVDAKIVVNGTADATLGAVYTTQGGADLCSEGNGVVRIDPGTETVTYQVIQAADPDDSTYVQIPITSAKLKNADGSYTDSTRGT
ncbi:MAG: hypothetical protein IJO88_07765 [Oscillospiraceae bacterium]|nr:hypothetical protein [Oscillospiraceae bacterium]